MTVCIQKLSKSSVTSEKSAFLAPCCDGCEVSYLFTSKVHRLKLVPDFKKLKVFNLDSEENTETTVESFCKDYIDPLDSIIVCFSQNCEEKSVAQLINDIQIYKSSQCLNGDDVVYKNDKLDHTRTCNSIHWHYQRTCVTVNGNSPLLCNLSNRYFVECYLPKAKFTQAPGLNLKALCLCPGQVVDDVGKYCNKSCLGILPWCKKIPCIPEEKLTKICKMDWTIGCILLFLGLAAFAIILLKYKDRRCYC